MISAGLISVDLEALDMFLSKFEKCIDVFKHTENSSSEITLLWLNFHGSIAFIFTRVIGFINKDAKLPEMEWLQMSILCRALMWTCHDENHTDKCR